MNAFLLKKEIENLIESAKMLYPYMPKSQQWDNKAVFIDNSITEMEAILLKMTLSKYPYECEIKETGNKFFPTSVDYENRQVYRTHSQNGAGQWYAFDELNFEVNPYFTT